MEPNDPYRPTPQSPHYVPPHHGQRSQQAAPQPAPQSYGGSSEPAHTPDYGFIMDASTQQKRPTNLPGGPNSSMVRRIMVVAGGLLVLIVGFVIVRGILNSGPSLKPVFNVIQDQQAILHILTEAQSETSLSAHNKNFVATAQLGLTSEQGTLIQFMAQNGQKIDPKLIGLKISTTTDKQLADAATASTYDSTFHEIMTSDLGIYKQQIEQAFGQVKNTEGRALLKKSYTNVQLLQTALDDKN